MKKGSLETIMEDMVRRLADMQPDGRTVSDPLKDLETFAAADPVLASLHKEYIEARNRMKHLQQRNGRDDPMTEVAADMFDSVRSAIQTRLIELQDMREEETRMLIERRLRAQRAGEEAASARRMIERRSREEKKNDLFFWAVMMLWLMRTTFNAASKRLSVANDFAIVSGGGRRARYA